MLCEEDGRRDSDTEQRIYYFYGVLPASRHSELWQECLVRRTGNGIVTQSEESITLNGILPVFLTMVTDPSHSFRMTIIVSLTTTANPLLMFRMTPNGNHMLRLLTHS